MNERFLATFDPPPSSPPSWTGLPCLPTLRMHWCEYRTPSPPCSLSTWYMDATPAWRPGGVSWPHRLAAAAALRRTAAHCLEGDTYRKRARRHAGGSARTACQPASARRFATVPKPLKLRLPAIAGHCPRPAWACWAQSGRKRLSSTGTAHLARSAGRPVGDTVTPRDTCTACTACTARRPDQWTGPDRTGPATMRRPVRPTLT